MLPPHPTINTAASATTTVLMADPPRRDEP